MPPPPRELAHRTPLLVRAVAFLRRHPIVALLALSPGIPEYLSSSSSMTGLVVAPPVFFVFLALNLGLYGPGVLLIREAAIRWRKGWGTIVLLGGAYAILEEGVALATFFNPTAGPVGALGYYGHYDGVSWVWATGLVMVHIVFSIALPILLLGLALPETRDRSLLSTRRVGYVAAIWGADVAVLFLVIVRGEHYWMGVPILLGSLAVIAVLAAAARWAPADLIRPRPGPPVVRPWVLAALGAALFPTTLLLEGFGEALRAPPVLVIGAMAAFFSASFALGRRWIGATGNAAHQVAFAGGVVGFVAFFGFVASLPFPVVLIADAAFAFLFLRLWRRYGDGPGARPIPPHALAS